MRYVNGLCEITDILRDTLLAAGGSLIIVSIITAIIITYLRYVNSIIVIIYLRY